MPPITTAEIACAARHGQSGAASGGGLRRQRACHVLIAAATLIFACAQTPAAGQTRVPGAIPTPPAAAPTLRSQGALTEMRAPPASLAANQCAAPAVETLTHDWTGDAADTGAASAAALVADAALYARGASEVLRDKVLARRLLERAAAMPGPTQPEAQRQLAVLLVDREAGTIDRARAESLLDAALGSRLPDAAITRARLHRTGQLPDTAPRALADVLGLAAGLGDARASIELASLYRLPGTAPPFEGAREHFTTLALLAAGAAISQGDCNVLVPVGDMLMENGDATDARYAVLWYEAAADRGDAAAKAKLAALLLTGTGLSADRPRAEALLHEAAEAGDFEAGISLARLWLEEGRKIEEAEALLAEGRRNHDPLAYALTASHYRGDYTAVSDPRRLTEVLDEALAQPYATAELLDVALANEGHLGGTTERIRTVRARLAALEDPDAAFVLARDRLETGTGLAQAERLLRRAATAGHPAAMAALADVLRCTPGANPQGEARHWLDAAVEAGHPGSLRSQGRAAMRAGRAKVGEDLLLRGAGAGDRLAMVELAIHDQDVGREDASRSQGGANAPTPGSDESVAEWIGRAGGLGKGVVAGRLGLLRALAQGSLAPWPGSEALLESLSRSVDGGVQLARAKAILGSQGSRSDVSSDKAPRADQAEAVALLEAAARQDDTEAMMLLTDLVDPSDVRSVSTQPGEPPLAEPDGGWLLEAARRGDPAAIGRLPDDPAIAADVLGAVRARSICDPLALLAIAELAYRHAGLDGRPDADLYLGHAITLARDNVEEDASDLFRIAEALASGSVTGTPDAERAAGLFRTAATAGHGKAAVALAGILIRSPERQSREAVAWLQKAAMTGEPSAIKQLAQLAGRDGIDADERGVALAALKAAAESGGAGAMNAYGSALLVGEPDLRGEGMALIERAAAAGNLDAMKSLARLHAAGLAGTPSPEKSAEWLRRAASEGDAEAMFRYAMALDTGFGVPQDPEEAARWMKKAKANGYAH